MRVLLVPNHRYGGPVMWQEIVRLLIAWGAIGVLIVFWYWMMSNIGTF